MQIHRKSWWRATGGIAIVLVSLIAHADPGTSKLVPPRGKFRDRTYQDLEARFWQIAFSIPIINGSHPLFTGGVMAVEDKIAFLPAPFGGAEISVTVKPGTALFVPIVNAECSEIEGDPFHGDDEAEQRACANAWIDGAYNIAASIDGEEVANILDFRLESAQFEFGPLPENNILGTPGGEVSTGVDAGYYLLIRPLNAGTHVIHLTGVLDPFTPEDASDDFVIDTIFNVTVSRR